MDRFPKVSSESVTVTCMKCKSVTIFSEGIPVRLQCNKCDGYRVRVETLNEEKRNIKFTCYICKKYFVAMDGEVLEAFHDVPNCKSFTFTMVSSSIEEKLHEEIRGEEESHSKIGESHSKIEKVSEQLSYYPQEKVFEKVKEKSKPLPGISAIVVCHNLVEFTQKCVAHLEKSKVPLTEIILVDNGSSDGTEDWSRSNVSTKFHYVRNQINLGCGIARNQGAKWAKCDYLFFLDNDQFISPSALDKLLYLGKDIAGQDLWEVASSDGFTKPIVEAGFNLHSYVGSGGMLVKREVFEALGGYDERYAPAWYEDVDFCFRARAAGYTIGAAKDCVIEHNGNSTINTQKTFDSRLAKTKSRNLFAQVWGKHIRDGSAPNMDLLPNMKVRRFNFGDKPKVVLLVDIPDWAWDFKAQQLKRYLSDEFDIAIAYTTNKKSFGEVFKRHDITFSFEISQYLPLIESNGKIKVSGVTAHTYVNFKAFDEHLSKVDAIYANSILLYKEIQRYNNNCFYLPNGVDQEQFAYAPRDINMPFTACYVGKNKARKGIDLIREMCEVAEVGLKEQTCKVKDTNRIPHSRMSDFYKDIDVVLVASTMDGTPNQLLEGAAVGRTCIGNCIGNVPEFIQDGYNGFIVDLKIEAYVEKLVWLKANRRRCADMGILARKTIDMEWTWARQVNNYRSMFRKLLDRFGE